MKSLGFFAGGGGGWRWGFFYKRKTFPRKVDAFLINIEKTGFYREGDFLLLPQHEKWVLLCNFNKDTLTVNENSHKTISIFNHEVMLQDC